ncbi:MAG TPA: hypothetical protein VKA79_05515 [Aestuariivirgaceae bacterium]|nr:hypothetical protein [Aestuariivirgaceae bacterium]
MSEHNQKTAPPAEVEAGSAERTPRARPAPEQSPTRTSRIDAVKAEVEDAGALRSKMIQAMRRKLERETGRETEPGEITPVAATLLEEFLEPVERAVPRKPHAAAALAPRQSKELVPSRTNGWMSGPAPEGRALRRPMPPASGESEIWDEAVQSAERVERALARLSEALAREDSAALGGGQQALRRTGKYRLLKVATVFGASFAIGISSLVLAYDWRSGTKFESRLATLARDLWPSEAPVAANVPAKAKAQAPLVKKAPAAKKPVAVAAAANGEPLPTKSLATVRIEALDAEGRADSDIPLTIKAVGTAAQPIYLRLAGLPGDAELSAGRRQRDGSWLLQPGQEEGLKLEMPKEASGSLMLTVEAVERSTGDLAAPPREIRVKIDPSQIIVEPAASKITPVSTRVEGAVALPAPPSAVRGLPVAESDEMAAAEEAAVAPAMAIGIDDPARPLMARGDALMVIGDVVSARSFYERAFSIGNVRAAWSIARTHDPLVLAALRVQGLRANPAKALEWYRKAETGEPGLEQAIVAMEQLVRE